MASLSRKTGLLGSCRATADTVAGASRGRLIRSPLRKGAAMPLLTGPHCGSAVPALDIETAPLRCPVCGAALTRAPEPAAPEPVPAALPIREAEVRDASYHSGWQDRDGDDSATRVARGRGRLEPI